MSPVTGCRSLSWGSGRSYSSRPLRVRVAKVDGRRPRRRTDSNVTVPRSRSSQSVQQIVSNPRKATRRRRMTMVLPRPRDASHGRSRRTEQPRRRPRRVHARTAELAEKRRLELVSSCLKRARLRTMYRSGRTARHSGSRQIGSTLVSPSKSALDRSSAQSRAYSSIWRNVCAR